MPPPNSTRSSSLPLAAAPMSNPSPSPFPSPPPNPIAAASSFLHHHLSRLASRFAAPCPALAAAHPPGPQGASLSLALTGKPVFTVCNPRAPPSPRRTRRVPRAPPSPSSPM